MSNLQCQQQLQVESGQSPNQALTKSTRALIGAAARPRQMTAPVPQLPRREATRAASLAPPLDGRVDLVIIRGVNLLASDFGGASLWPKNHPTIESHPVRSLCV